MYTIEEARSWIQSNSKLIEENLESSGIPKLSEGVSSILESASEIIDLPENISVKNFQEKFRSAHSAGLYLSYKLHDLNINDDIIKNACTCCGQWGVVMDPLIKAVEYLNEIKLNDNIIDICGAVLAEKIYQYVPVNN